MTSKQEYELNEARSCVKRAVKVIDTLLEDKDISPDDFDSDLSDAINNCHNAVEYLSRASIRY